MTKPEPSWVHVHNKDEMEAFYRGVLPNIITEAKYHGYAIGLHGSLRRDLDLIAVPWTDDHSDKDELARAVQEAACGMSSAKYQWEKKPCGRWAASFPICWTEMTNELSLGHIDLSVMASALPEAPRSEEAAVLAAAKRLAHYLEEGWDEQDDPADVAEADGACDGLVKAVKALLCAPSPLARRQEKA